MSFLINKSKFIFVTMILVLSSCDKLDTIESDVTDLQTQIDQANIQIQTIKTMIEAIEEKAQSDIESLKSLINDLNTTYVTLNALVVSLELRISALEDTQNSITEQITSLKEQTEALIVQLSDLQSQINELNKKLISIESRLDVVEANIDSLGNQVVTLAGAFDYTYFYKNRTTSTSDKFVESKSLSFTTSANDIYFENLTVGSEFYFKVSGSYGVASGHLADAAYNYQSNGSVKTAEPYMAWDWNGLQTQRPNPDTYNSSHVYYYYFTASASSEHIKFFDSLYGDNQGSLTFELYERNASETITYGNGIYDNNLEFLSPYIKKWSNLEFYFTSDTSNAWQGWGYKYDTVDNEELHGVSKADASSNLTMSRDAFELNKGLLCAADLTQNYFYAFHGNKSWGHYVTEGKVVVDTPCGYYFFMKNSPIQIGTSSDTKWYSDDPVYSNYKEGIDTSLNWYVKIVITTPVSISSN